MYAEVGDSVRSWIWGMRRHQAVRNPHPHRGDEPCAALAVATRRADRRIGATSHDGVASAGYATTNTGAGPPARRAHAVTAEQWSPHPLRVESDRGLRDTTNPARDPGAGRTADATCC